MSDDIRKEPVRRRRVEPPVEPSDDDLDVAYGDEPPYPPLVTAAGWIWIAFGCIVLLNMVLIVLLSFAAGAGRGGAEGASTIGGGLCIAIVVGLFGAVFLHVGNQSVRGTARDTLGNGVGSMLFGLFYFGGAAAQTAIGQIVQAGVAGLGGVLLLTAGLLALIGRGQYKLWRKSQKDQLEREAAARKGRRRGR